MPVEKKPDDMNEQELAIYYEAHKGDTSLWESKPAKIRLRRGGPSTVFALRLTPDEIELLQAAAANEERTLSDFIRSAALKAAESSVTRERI